MNTATHDNVCHGILKQRSQTCGPIIDLNVIMKCDPAQGQRIFIV